MRRRILLIAATAASAMQKGEADWWIDVPSDLAPPRWLERVLQLVQRL
jgi:hypothetical protein